MRSIAPQPDGKFIIAGSFTSVGGVSRARIARVESDGKLDLSFDPHAGPNGDVTALALQKDGKVVIVGNFTSVGGLARAKVARLNTDGSVDSSYTPGIGPDGEANALLLDPDDRAIIGGGFQSWDGIQRHFLARLTSNGSLDPAFDAGAHFATFPNAPSTVAKFALQSDGRLIVGGFFVAEGIYDLVRVAPDGTVDTSFQARGVSIQNIIVQPDSKIVISGGFLSPNRESISLARFNVDGSFDPTFKYGVNGGLGSVMRLQPDGKLLIVEQQASPLIRLNTDGSLDPSFYASPSGDNLRGILCFEVLRDARVIVAGEFTAVNNWPRENVARVFNNGRVDPGFIVATGASPTRSVGLNFSTRMKTGTGDDALIGGFMIGGNGTKKIAIRAIGPSMNASGGHSLSTLADPALELYDRNGSVIGRNDNWRISQRGGVVTSDQAAEIAALGLAPADDAESALIAVLDPGDYTAVVRGRSGASGTALVELYDLESDGHAFLSNISTRGLVETGDDILISGAILGGNDLSEVVVRAIGPSLRKSGLSDVLENPVLELHNSNGELVMTNDDWQDTQPRELAASGLAPEDPKEAALLAVLSPGLYTAIVRGAQNAVGIALVEMFVMH